MHTNKDTHGGENFHFVEKFLSWVCGRNCRFSGVQTEETMSTYYANVLTTTCSSHAQRYPGHPGMSTLSPLLLLNLAIEQVRLCVY